VELHRPVRAQKNTFTVILAEDLEVHHFCIKMAFELHRELRQLVDADARGVRARREEELAVGGQLEAVGRRGEAEVLDQLDAATMFFLKVDSISFYLVWF